MTMLSVAGARTKARARLNSSMAAWAAEGSGVVRLEIALKPPTEKQVLTDQAAAAEWAGSWRAVEETAIGWASPTAPGSVAGTRSGLEIDWEDRNWARVGRQRIPLRVRLTTADAVADFVGGESARDWRRLRDRAATIRDRFELSRAASNRSTPMTRTVPEPAAPVTTTHSPPRFGPRRSGSSG